MAWRSFRYLWKLARVSSRNNQLIQVCLLVFQLKKQGSSRCRGGEGCSLLKYQHSPLPSFSDCCYPVHRSSLSMNVAQSCGAGNPGAALLLLVAFSVYSAVVYILMVSTLLCLLLMLFTENDWLSSYRL